MIDSGKWDKNSQCIAFMCYFVKYSGLLILDSYQRPSYCVYWSMVPTLLAPLLCTELDHCMIKQISGIIPSNAAARIWSSLIWFCNVHHSYWYFTFTLLRFPRLILFLFDPFTLPSAHSTTSCSTSKIFTSRGRNTSSIRMTQLAYTPSIL